MEKSQKVKGIISIIGGLFIHIINGSIYSWGNISIYLISYLRIYQNDLSLREGFFILPFAVFSVSLTLTLGSFLDKKVGPRM